jgi:16S rRNA processing protein RimM
VGAPTDDERWMVIGTIVGSFGVHGELKVELNTDFPERFSRLETVYVGPQRLPRTVLASRRHQGRVLLRIVGVESPEQGDMLRGKELAVPRSEAMPLPAGHYYLDDLLGIEVSAVDGRRLGLISDVLRTGNNDVYVVNTGTDAILVPGIKDAVHELDLDARRLVVEPWVLDVDE